MAGGRERSGVASGRHGKRGDAGAAKALAGRQGASPAGGESNGRSREDVPMERRRSAHQASKEPAVGGHAMIDLEFLRGLIGAVDASGIDSIEITRAGTRIRINKTPPTAGPVPVQAVMAPPMAVPGPAAMSFPTHGTHAPHSPSAGAHLDAHAATSAPAAEAPARSDLLEIKSPMVGTFYRSPAPEAPPYVEVGSHITRGQTLCILEAMKLMNELESEVEGVVREVLVENAEPVEFGQVLFRIEPVRR